VPDFEIVFMVLGALLILSLLVVAIVKNRVRFNAMPEKSARVEVVDLLIVKSHDSDKYYGIFRFPDGKNKLLDLRGNPIYKKDTGTLFYKERDEIEGNKRAVEMYDGYEIYIDVNNRLLVSFEKD